MASRGTRPLLPERGPTLIDRRACVVCDGVGGQGAGSTRGVGGLVFARAVVEHGKIGACERFCASYTTSCSVLAVGTIWGGMEASMGWNGRSPVAEMLGSGIPVYLNIWIYASICVVSDEQGGSTGCSGGFKGGEDMGAAGEGLHALAVARAGRCGAGFGDLGSGMGMGTGRETRGWEAIRRRVAGTGGQDRQWASRAGMGGRYCCPIAAEWAMRCRNWRRSLRSDRAFLALFGAIDS